jgi:hypothetical protein
MFVGVSHYFFLRKAGISTLFATHITDSLSFQVLLQWCYLPENFTTSHINDSNFKYIYLPKCHIPSLVTSWGGRERRYRERPNRERERERERERSIYFLGNQPNCEVWYYTFHSIFSFTYMQWSNTWSTIINNDRKVNLGHHHHHILPCWSFQVLWM